jgi:hypothetical protein
MVRIHVRALVVRNDAKHSSRRTLDGIAGIFQGVNEIWRPADVQFDVAIREWTPESADIEEIANDASRRMDDCPALGKTVGHPPRQITVVYLRSIGGSSGKVFRPRKALVVVDETKVSASRTTAHEIGHLFGLEHWIHHRPPEPPDRPPNHLMARTQLGTELTTEDIDKVRRALPETGLLA